MTVVGTFARRWSPEQRTAFLAGLAERWLPTYVRFTRWSGRGDAPGVRGALDAVWNHLSGKKLSLAEVDHLGEVVLSAAPSSDEFDAHDALMACQFVGLAVASCATGSEDRVVQAVAAAYDAVAEPVPGHPLDPKWTRAMWLQPAVKAEVERLLALLRQVSSATEMTPAAAESLRRSQMLIRRAPATAWMSGLID